jgi:hypothetical protein
MVLQKLDMFLHYSERAGLNLLCWVCQKRPVSIMDKCYVWNGRQYVKDLELLILNVMYTIYFSVYFFVCSANGDIVVTLLPVNTRWPWITPAQFRPELVPEELMAQGLTVHHKFLSYLAC